MTTERIREAIEQLGTGLTDEDYDAGRSESEVDDELRSAALAELDRLEKVVEALREIQATHKARGYCLWAQDIAEAALSDLEATEEE
jgi:hypothetical protein